MVVVCAKRRVRENIWQAKARTCGNKAQSATPALHSPTSLSLKACRVALGLQHAGACINSQHPRRLAHISIYTPATHFASRAKYIPLHPAQSGRCCLATLPRECEGFLAAPLEGRGQPAPPRHTRRRRTRLMRGKCALPRQSPAPTPSSSSSQFPFLRFHPRSHFHSSLTTAAITSLLIYTTAAPSLSSVLCATNTR